MDVSPKTLREVEFREKMRGYHPEDVDHFLEEVAAGLEVLQDRLRQAVERAQRAEAAAAEAEGSDETLRKTLVLAQRTADMAVQEAREQAARSPVGWWRSDGNAGKHVADDELHDDEGHQEGQVEHAHWRDDAAERGEDRFGQGEDQTAHRVERRVGAIREPAEQRPYHQDQYIQLTENVKNIPAVEAQHERGLRIGTGRALASAAFPPPTLPRLTA